MSQLPDRAEAEHGRRTPIDEPERDVSGPVAPASLKSWREVREWSADLLVSRTGEDVAAWNRRVAEAGLDDEQALRSRPAGKSR